MNHDVKVTCETIKNINPLYVKTYGSRGYAAGFSSSSSSSSSGRFSGGSSSSAGFGSSSSSESSYSYESQAGSGGRTGVGYGAGASGMETGDSGSSDSGWVRGADGTMTR